MPLIPPGEFPTGLALRGLVAALLKELASSASVATSQGTTSTTYTDLATAGPAVTITSVYDRALIFWSAGKFSNVAGNGVGCTVAITGATTLAAADSNGVNASDVAGSGFGDESMQFIIATINPGSNTYTMKYRATGSTANFQRRRLYVIAP